MYKVLSWHNKVSHVHLECFIMWSQYWQESIASSNGRFMNGYAGWSLHRFSDLAYDLYGSYIEYCYIFN